MIMSMLESQRSPGGGPHRPLPSRYHGVPGGGGRHGPLHPDPRYESLQRLALVQIHPPRNPNKPLTPFFITDILNGRVSGGGGSGIHGGHGGGVEHRHPGQDPRSKTPRHHPAISHPLPLAPQPQKAFIRPWDAPTPTRTPPEDDDDSRDIDVDDDDEDMEIQVDDETVPQSAKSCSPLDALFQMTSKTFDGRDAHAHLLEDGSKKDQLSLFSKSQPPKKRRKSRTAFTNQQIYELEKRFLYQKYLTPADRDEIAQNLGLTNAQVITWFQNRRAKLKRDLEEIKADVVAAKTVLPAVSPGGVESPEHGRHSPTGSAPYIRDMDDLYAKHGLSQHASTRSGPPSSVGSPARPSQLGSPGQEIITRNSESYHSEQEDKEAGSRSGSPVERAPSLSPCSSPSYHYNKQSCDHRQTGPASPGVPGDSPRSPHSVSGSSPKL